MYTLHQRKMKSSQKISLVTLGWNLAAEKRIMTYTMCNTRHPSKHMMPMYDHALNRTFYSPSITQNRRGALRMR